MRKDKKVYMHISRARELLQQNDNLSFGVNEKRSQDREDLSTPIEGAL